MFSIRGDTVVVTIPTLTAVGEVFDLPESHFSKGSLGEVEEVLGQSAGRTQVLLRVTTGKALRRRKEIVLSEDMPETVYDKPPQVEALQSNVIDARKEVSEVLGMFTSSEGEHVTQEQMIEDMDMKKPVKEEKTPFPMFKLRVEETLPLEKSSDPIEVVESTTVEESEGEA